MSDKFNLPHLALYSKGWYRRENKQTISYILYNFYAF